jgi:hypothetical protein
MRIESGTPTSAQGPLPRGWIIVFSLWFVAGLNYLDRNLITTMRGSVSPRLWRIQSAGRVSCRSIQSHEGYPWQHVSMVGGHVVDEPGDDV